MDEQREQMLPATAVMIMIGVKSPTTLRALIRDQDFPQPYEIVRGKRHWAHSEVQFWLKQRMAQQRGERRSAIS